MHTTEYTSFYSRIAAADYFRDYGDFSEKTVWETWESWGSIVVQAQFQLQPHIRFVDRLDGQVTA